MARKDSKVGKVGKACEPNKCNTDPNTFARIIIRCSPNNPLEGEMFGKHAKSFL